MDKVYKSQEAMIEHYSELKANLLYKDGLLELLELAEAVGYAEGFEEGIKAGMERETIY